MKKIYFLLLTLFFAATSQSQNVTVSGALVGNGSYPDMGTAFTAINGGAQTGATIIISVTGNTTEAVSAVLNAGAWTSVTISPSGGAARTISGAITGVLIDLNGADNVTIDGLNTGGNSLTLVNTAVAASNTLRFINDASNNTVQKCSIQGSASTASNAVIFFSTGTTTGNDGNNINNCDITAAGANQPINGIFSSGTSAAIDNSGNTIANNNISDYFNAALVSTGINIAASSSAWTINNNKLFQTATRLYTTAQTHNGINIASGSGYTISGNIIGFANSTGTGTTNMVGNSVALTGTFPSSYTTTGTANATRYIAINCAFTAGGTVSNIQNNTIAGFALYTSSGAATTNGIFCGIAVTSGNVNIGTTTGNTIGATTGNGSIYAACTTTGGIIAGIYVSSTNAIAIRNNTIGALEAMGTTATICGGINGINIAGAASSYDVSGNTIGNSTTPNLRMGNLTTGANLSNVGTTFGVTTGLGQFNGILSSATTAGTIGTAALPNIITNASLNSSSATASIRGITASGAPIISNNNINNLTSQTTNAGVASTLLAGMGIFLNSISTTGAVVRNNTINSLSLTNPTTNGTNLCGIAIYAGASDFYGNKIYDLVNASTSVTAATPGTASGFFLRQPAGTHNIYNNMVSLGNGQTTNTAFNGIWQQNSVVAYTLNAYFNSFNIEGVAASGANPSFCLNRGSYSATTVVTPVSILNNIFINTRSGGTGVHCAIGNCFGATAVNTGWPANASNYNVLNAAAATVGYWTSALTFAGWQAASASDVNSISGGTVNWVNTATADLHITTPYPSIVEGAGVDVPLVTTDFDGQTRSALSPVDIGADAGNFSNSPAISFTALANACVTGARTLNTTITDPDGVPTSGIGLPVLYWRINAGAYTPATATFVSGSQYNFTFGAGAVIGDVVSYYVAAQDNLANVGTSPAFGASGFTANPPAASTPPSSPYSYTITPTLSGTYTVGVGGNYTTLTAAAAAYSNNCLGGPVIFSLTDATYPSETFPINFNANPGASAINTLTIKPTGTTTISGSTLSTIIQINGGDYITIDGSAGNTVNSICPPVSATRNLTIQNTNTTSFAAVVWLNTVASPVNGVTNCTVKNCIIIGGSNVNTAAGIGIGALPLISGGIDNDFNRIENNDIQACRFGIYVVGQSAANKNDGNVITQNIMTAASPNNIGEGGIFSAYETNLTISGNQIDNIIRTASPDAYGINLGFGITSGIGSTTAAIVDAIGNATITYNKIGRIENSGTFAAAGLALGNTVSGTQLIANNTISGVNANGTGLDFSVGLWLDGGTGTTNIYNNTVAMQGIQAGASAGSQTSTCLGIRALSTPININNNIFSNTQGGGAAGTTTRYATIALGYASPYTGMISNNNDLYSAGAGPGTYTVGITGGVAGGTSRVTLANWQTETGTDALSKNVLPVFVSATDLHLANTAGANWCLNGTGVNIPAVTNDIDCQARNNPPDIGADEFVAVGGDIATPASQTICSGNPITSIVLSGGSTSYSWIRDNTVAVTGIPANGTGNISGTLVNTTASPVIVTFTITAVDANGCAGPAFTATVTVNPLPAATIAYAGSPYCSSGGTATVTRTGTAGGTYSSTPGLSINAATGDVTLGTSTAGTYTVTYTIAASGGCPLFSTTASITITAAPSATISYTGSPYCLSAGTATVTRTGTAGGTYSSTAGLTINAATGDVTLGTSTPGTYTVTYSIAASAGCPLYTATTSITVNALPIIGSSQVEPTTCISTDGSITLTLSGAAGPYGFAWTGPGVNPTSQNQTGLIAGSYSVTVTAANFCQATANFTLNGPGGCSVCPTFGSFTSTPSGTACSSNTITLTQSGLTGMGVTYGITFKQSLAALADPYVGGTVIATVPNGGLTGGGTVASTTTTLPGGAYFIYAILSPTPISPACRPSSLINLTVTQLPAATISYAGTPYCQNAGTANVTRTGTAGGTYSSTAGLTINAATGAVTLGTSTPGTYTVTYTIAAAGGCPIVTATTSITITALPAATISYAGTPYCSNAGTATVTQTGTAGGTYSSTAGLTINAATGAVTLGTSTPGTYTVTYTIAAGGGCPVVTATASITITALPVATIAYTGSPYCSNAGTATVTQTGTAGGTYSSTAGLSINAATGAVTLGTSTPGTYTVTYTIAAGGGCPVVTATATITITALPVATIAYTGSPYCSNAGTATVTQTGTAGGTYSSTAGLSINAATGAVTLGTSTAGTYTVTYTIAAGGGCPAVTATASITITALPAATISYTGSPYCPTGTATVTRTGTAGGTYSSTAGLTITAATGDVNLATSTPGTYTVTYTMAAGGGCPAVTTTASITINSLSVAATAANSSVTSNCGSTTVNLSITGGSLGTGGVWRWYSGTCGGTLVGVGATLNNIAVNTTTTYFVRAEGTCNTTACASVTVTINVVPTISIAASPRTSLMPGLTTTLTATVTPTTGNAITWYRDGIVVAPVGPALTLVVNADQLGVYTARATTPAGCTALSNSVTIADSSSNKLWITPNPNNGRFQVRYYTSATNVGTTRTLAMWADNGQKVYEKSFPINAPYSSMDVNATHLAKGVYVIMLIDASGNKLATGRVVLQ